MYDSYINHGANRMKQHLPKIIAYAVMCVAIVLAGGGWHHLPL